MSAPGNRLKLREMDIIKMGQLANLSVADFDNYLRELGLLWSHRNCDVCGRNMKIYGWRGTRPRYECTTFRCKGTRIGYLKGTFFEKTKIDRRLIFLYAYFWCQDLGTMSAQMINCRLTSSHTAVDYAQFFRDVVINRYYSNPPILGTAGKRVYLDETCIVKRKHNTGRLVRKGVNGAHYEDIYVEKIWKLQIPLEERFYDLIEKIACEYPVD